MAFNEGLASALAHIQALVVEIRHFWDDSAPAQTVRPALDTVIQICDRLPLAIQALIQRRGSRPPLEMADEYDVQYLLGSILVIHFDDVRPEEPNPSMAGAATRVDYWLKAEQLMVETKMTRKALGEKEVGEELLVDIQKYEARPDCETLVCLVYDPGRRVANPRGLERDLEATARRLKVRVLVRS